MDDYLFSSLCLMFFSNMALRLETLEAPASKVKIQNRLHALSFGFISNKIN
jgi:hypothetical protein